MGTELKHIEAEVAFGPGDFEPISQDERCDAAYGPYHIGRDDEGRPDLALFFDASLLPEEDYEDVVHHYLVSELTADVQFTHFGHFQSEEHSQKRISYEFNSQMSFVREFAYSASHPPYVVVVNVSGEQANNLVEWLASYPPFVGCADLSRPTWLRTILHETLFTRWDLAWEHEDNPTHWIHKINR